MEATAEKKVREITGTCNTEAIMKAAAIVLFATANKQQLEDGQKLDLISAAIDMVRTVAVDDITHTIGIGTEPDQVVVERLAGLGVAMEGVRDQRLRRFMTLCEMLKPEVNIEFKIIDHDKEPA